MTILDVQTVAPVAASDRSATDMVPTDGVGRIPDCKWELKFSSVVDEICRGSVAAQPSFLSFSFD